MITANSLEFLLPLRWAAITLKLSFKPLIMFLREQKEPRELNSHSRLKRIITPLRQFQTWAFNTPEDYYDVTVSICVLVHCVCLLSATSRTRCFSGTPKLSPPSRRNQTPLAGRRGELQTFCISDIFCPSEWAVCWSHCCLMWRRRPSGGNRAGECERPK